MTFLFLGMAVLFLPACSDEETGGDLPLSALIFHSLDGKQAAFTALTHSAVSWEWDFGDGNGSTEKNPVHVYEEGGYYLAKLTAKDKQGNSVTAQVNLAVALTPYALLTGNHTAEGYDGKTWRLTQAHTVNDKLVNSDASFSLLDEDIPSLPAGAFSVYVGLPEAYNDEFTFYYDGRYRHNTRWRLIRILLHLMHELGRPRSQRPGEAVFGQDVFAMTTCTPSDNATFLFNENEDFTIPTIPILLPAQGPEYHYHLSRSDDYRFSRRWRLYRNQDFTGK